MNIVLLGAPASGKGTQAELLANKFKLFHLSTGDLSRSLAEKSERIKQIVDSGKLIPEQEMTMHVLDYLKSVKPDLSDILFEGFPRFVSQYQALKNFMKVKNRDIDLVISLDISKESAVKRISSRRICSGCHEVFNLITNPPKTVGRCDRCGGGLIQREDDMPEAIHTRFEYYEHNTKELIDYMDANGKLVRVNGEMPIEKVFDEIVTKVENVKTRNTN